MVYNYSGTSIQSVYLLTGSQYNHAYDIEGNDLLSGEEPWNPTPVSYDMNWLINSAWLANAATQRDAIKSIYQQSEDAIPFFIQTDGHGRLNEGNKGCHNLAESVMRYIPNLQLGDYASYYSNGNNPANHASSSAGIANYFSAMGNHEFMLSSSDTGLASLPVLVASYTPPQGVLGSETYGYYKKVDTKYGVKFLVTQPHIPDENNSSGFVTKMTSDQYEWLINELEANDDYDIIFLQHEGLNGTYTKLDGTTYNVNYPAIDVNTILSARKAKTSGSYTDSYGVTHLFDFTRCTTDLLCSFHGHWHVISYMTKQALGFPVFVGRDMTNNGDCVYGIIDREGGYMYIYPFGRDTANEPIVLAL